MSRYAAAAGLVLGVSLLVSGCGDDQPPGGAADPGAQSSCVAAATEAATPYPANFPKDWPFPPGTVVTDVSEPDDETVVLTAISSLDFDRVLEFFRGDVARAGFVSHGGEAEADDAESEWSGGGFHGRWALQGSRDCEGDTVFQVLSSRG